MTTTMAQTKGRRRTGRIRLGTWVIVIALSACLWGSAPLAQAPQRPPARPPAAQDEYVPIDQIPEHDKLPAAPYLIGAYTVAWLMVLLYVWSLWRRLTRVEQELKRVASTSLES
jgi:CcmD family protein